MILRFRFLVFWSNCKVNNLATVRSITWPHFLQKNWKMWPSYWPYSFTCFLLKLVLFSNISFSLHKEVWKTKNNKNNEKRWPSCWLMVAKLLTLQYIYIYAVKLLSGPKFGPFQGLLSGPSKGYYLVQGDLGPMFKVVSSDFVQIQLSFCVFFGAQRWANFLQIAVLKKGCKNPFESNFCVVCLLFENSLFRFAKSL